MNLKYDGMELACSRAKEVEVTLDIGDCAILKLGSNEVQVKFIDGQWRIFCSSNVSINQESNVRAEYSV